MTLAYGSSPLQELIESQKKTSFCPNISHSFFSELHFLLMLPNRRAGSISLCLSVTGVAWGWLWGNAWVVLRGSRAGQKGTEPWGTLPAPQGYHYLLVTVAWSQRPVSFIVDFSPIMKLSSLVLNLLVLNLAHLFIWRQNRLGEVMI